MAEMAVEGTERWSLGSLLDRSERGEALVRSREMTSLVDEMLDVQMDNGQTTYINRTLTHTLQSQAGKPTHPL